MSIPSQLTDEDICRIANRLEDIVVLLVPLDEHGVPLITRDQRVAIDAFVDWLEDNYGPPDVDDE